MAKYRMYVEQIWHYSQDIEADNYDEALEKASDIMVNVDPFNTDMTFSDEYIDVEEIKS